MTVVGLDLSDDALAAELVRVQRAAYLAEAELIGHRGIPALAEGVADLRASGETLLGILRGRRLAAAIGFTLSEGVLDIHRLVVDPPCARRGLGRALVRAAEAAAPAARRAVVSTGAANAPALALYAAEGYRRVGSRDALPGLTIALLEKRL